jgi:hypothetical protein
VLGNKLFTEQFGDFISAQITDKAIVQEGGLETGDK